MPTTIVTIGSDPDMIELYAIDTDACTPHYPMDDADVALWAALLWADGEANARPQYSAINSNAIFVPKSAVQRIPEASGTHSVAFSILYPDRDVLLCERFDPEQDGVEDMSHLLATCVLTQSYADTQPGPAVNPRSLDRLESTLAPAPKSGCLVEELRFESIVGIALLDHMLATDPDVAFPTEAAFNLVLEVATTERRRMLGRARLGDGFTDYILNDLFNPGLVRWTRPSAERPFALNHDLLTRLLRKAPQPWIATGQRLAHHIAKAPQEVVLAAVAHIMRTDPAIKRTHLRLPNVSAHQAIAGAQLVGQMQEAVRSSLL